MVGKIEGPRDAQIVHFLEDRRRSLVREAIQNSLDAAAPESKHPVEVEFKPTSLATTMCDGVALAERLEAAARSNANDDEGLKKAFRRGAHLLMSGGSDIPCLEISDFNTTGAKDSPADPGSPWQALTKGSGFSSKNKRDAAGSFGLGKFASFAASEIRTVIFNTAFFSRSAGLERRMQGRSVLVSHDVAEEPFHAEGYLGGPDFRPLSDGQIPEPFQRSQPGLTLHVLGFSEDDGFWDDATAVAVRDFFHAIQHANLVLTINGQRIAEATIEQTSRDLAAKKERLLGQRDLNFMRVSRQPRIQERKHFDGIGRVTLFLDVYEDPSRTDREIALVRDAGMKITSDPHEMKALRLQRFSRSWRGFTLLIECHSGGEDSLLRDSESPQHNAIAPDFITDVDRRKKATRALETLGAWVRTQLKTHAGPIRGASGALESGVDGLNISDPGSAGNPSPTGRGGVDITSPDQRRRRRRRPSLPPADPSQGDTPVPSSQSSAESPREPPGVPGPPPGPKPADGHGRRSQRRRSRARGSLANLRFLAVDGTSHGAVFAFDHPGGTMRQIRVVAVPETGPPVPLGIRKAWKNRRTMFVDHGRIRALRAAMGTRVTVEIRTREPVQGKSLDIVYRY